MLNTSSSRRLGEALQSCSHHGQDRERGLIEHHRLGDGKRRGKIKTVFEALLPGVLFLLFLKLSYIPHHSAYFTYLGKASSLSWLQSISDNQIAHMFQEKPVLSLLDFLLLSGEKENKFWFSFFFLLLLFPIMIWIANISIPTRSPWWLLALF